MKNLIKLLILLCCITTIGCKAQSNVINITDRCNNAPLTKTNGSLYLKDINNIYNPYVGTWKWSQGNRELILTLIKQTKYHYNLGGYNFYQDRLVGYYVYKENGITLINITTDDLTKFSPKVDFDLACDSDLTGTIDDVLKNKTYNSSFKIVSPTQIKFEGEESTHVRRQKEGYPTLPPVYAGNTFPLEMILTKQ